MANYVGIDLGTTNSVVCSYDPEVGQPRVFKSPEQNDVTPSAIYFDRRGKYHGARAYRMAAYAPDNTAILFKRLMGTATQIKIAALGLTMSPEECSAEILRVLFGYLPEEIRNAPDTGTVITVPAAFNQMQKNATVSAAEKAGLGRTALMQEPVAAVMSVMRTRKSDGMFLVYDLGGGTLDVALGESLAGRVSLLEHGGVAMCGGRDWDRAIVDNVVKPWLMETFALPEGFAADPRFSQLARLAAWAAEQAKVELSARDSVSISLPDVDIHTKDLDGTEIYLDVPLDRKTLDRLIEERVVQSIEATREVLEKARVPVHDVERIVFVGGPTQYKPLRDRVSSELGVPGSTEVNPMTAVAEGAAVFAESIDWSTASRNRKNTRGTLAAGGSLALAFAYQSRTPALQAKVVVEAKGRVAPGSTFQIDSLESGWSSGRIDLRDGTSVILTLSKNGENRFKVFVFDSAGAPQKLADNVITIMRTAATVDAIPASHSIGVAAKDKIGGQIRLDYLVKSGDPLPKKGERIYRAETSLRAGGPGAFAIQLWEGEIDNPYEDNRLIGALKITGGDFEEGVIAAGAELRCAYEVTDAGNITFTVTVPTIGGTFGEGHNFYSRQDGQIDFADASELVTQESEELSVRLDEIAEKVEDARLDEARQKVHAATELVDAATSDPESTKQAMDNILDAKKLLAKVRRSHTRDLRGLELEGVLKFFNDVVRPAAKPSEATQFENLRRAAERAIPLSSGEFETKRDEMRELNFRVLWRQDWFVIQKLQQFMREPHMFLDKPRYLALVRAGQKAQSDDDVEKLREILSELWSFRLSTGSANESEHVNIVRG